MADTKVSALTAVSTPAGTDEFPVNQSSASKKETLAQVRTFVRATTVPSIISVGTEFSGTGVPTATLPGTHATNDILVLVLQSSNDSVVSAPAGYKQLGPESGIGAAATAGSVKLSIFWKRDGGSESAPTIPDTGDHTYGMMFAVRSCPTTGDPFHFGGVSWKFTASTTGTGPKSSTCVDNVLIVDIFGGSADNAAAEGSSPTNADLASLTEQFDDGTTDGTGGFIYVVSGIVAVAQTVVATTVTWANSSSDVCSRVQFIPADANSDVPTSRTVDTQIFIGSPADLDDSWIKPKGARRVFAQILDGAGSGSSGRSASTASGGAGGGGGGYDEAWYNADDLAATVTVHAGKGGAQSADADGAAGNAGVVSQFDKGGVGPLTSAQRIAGTAAVGATSADGGNGGCGSGQGAASPSVITTRRDLTSANAAVAFGFIGGAGGNGVTTPVGGSPAMWGGGGGESGADTDAAITSANNGYSIRGGGGGAGGRAAASVASGSGRGGGAAAQAAAAGSVGTDSTMLPYGAAGGGPGSDTVAAGAGGFPGGGGGGGATTGSTQHGAAGGHGMVMVTTHF